MTQTIDNPIDTPMSQPIAGNEFSWKRAWAISSLYNPAIKWQMGIYALLSLLTGLVTYALNATIFGLLSYGLLGTVTSLLFYFGPLIFTRKSNLVIETTLPATNAEKCAFYVLYCVVIIPILLYVPYYAVMFIGNAIHPIAENISGLFTIQSSMLKDTYGISMFQSLLPTTVCLFVAMSSKKNRIVKAVLWTVGVQVAMAILGGIYGIVMALNGTMPDPTGSDPTNAYAIGQQIGYNLKGMIMAIGALCAIVSGILIWLTCRTISHRQL